MMTLRQYQWEAAEYAADYILNGEPAVGIIAPTGAGKSTIITVLLNMVMGRKKGALIAPPQKAIERGFNDGQGPLYRPDSDTRGRVSVAPVGNSDIYVSLRNEPLNAEGKAERAKGILEGLVRDGVAKRCGLTTHQQLVHWGTDILLDDMTDRILVLDEAHHAGTTVGSDDDDDEAKRKAEEGTKLGALAKEWQARGGQVVYVTATPYRNDGSDVIPDGAPTFTWTIAQHSQGEYAPKNFSLGTVPVGVEVSSPNEYAGENLPSSEAQDGEGYTWMVDQWVADGKPKSVFVVPAKESLQWAGKLERALTNAGARVCNAVGTDAATDTRFAKALEAERKATTYADSTVDVFIACKRFDEGTDWALCSHVYQWGVPSSFGLIVQRWGRAFRVKSRYADYPAHLREEARLTFFVPKIRAGAENRFKQKHHEHSWLLGTFLADWKTGRQYHNSLRLRFDAAWERRTPTPADAAAERALEMFGERLDDAPAGDGVLTPDDRARIEGEQAAILSDKRRADATLLIAEYETLLTDTETGVGPTASQIQQAMAERGVGEDMADAVMHVLAERIVGDDPAAAATLDAMLDDVVRSRDPLSGIIRKDLVDVFRAIVNRYGDRTVPVAANVIGYITQFTGETAIEVAEKLRDALDKPDFTVDGLERAIRAYHAEHGEAPTQDSGDASKYFGWPEGTERWSNVSQCIKAGRRGLEALKGFGGLHGYCIHLGLKFDKPDFTVDGLERAIRAYHAEHGEAPTLKGDASKYFGWPEGTESWSNVDACIRNGGRGLWALKEFGRLHRYCIHLGLKAPNFTVEGLERAIRAYHAERKKAPSVKGGDASKYFGWPEGTESWANVNACIGNGNRGLGAIKGFGGLHGYCIHLGLKADKDNITVEGLERAIRTYYDEHGKAPTLNGDASKYFGWPEETESWVGVNSCIRNGCRGLEPLKGFGSLSKYCIHLGLKAPNFTVDGLERAVRAYHAEHGEAPTKTGCDASKYFGWPDGTETWMNVSECIGDGRRGLESIKGFGGLHGYCIHLGLKNPDFTVDGLERAIRAYHDEHGKVPAVTSGDASKYLGWPKGTESWGNVNACITAGRRGLEALKGFGSLSKYCTHLGLKNPDITVEGLERAIRAYYEKNGEAPSVKSGDASKYFGWPDGTASWGDVQDCIRQSRRGLESIKGFGGLHRYCIHLGLKNPDFTVDGLERAIRAYHAEHGKVPAVTSGDASKYLGWPKPEQWSSVNACITAGRRGLEPIKEHGGLNGYCVHLGLKTEISDLTVERLERAVRIYYDEHGKTPPTEHGDASKYLGWPDGTLSWSNINQRIRNGGRGLESLKMFGGLHGYCIHLSLKADKDDFTVGQVENAVRVYHAEHGKAPTLKGDASKYFGRPEGTETWMNVSQCIKAGRRGLDSIKEFGGLHRYCIHLGLKNPDFTVDGLGRAIRTYHAEHGKAPSHAGGDASKYFGWPEAETWAGVNSCIRNGSRGLESLKGSTLSQFCRKLGLK